MTNEMLKRHEGFRQFIYKCTAGKNTIGYGLNLDEGITEEEASLLLDLRVKKIRYDLREVLSFYEGLSATRKDVLVNMAYNLGVGGLLKFKETLRLIGEGKFEEASIQMLKSKWATQVPNRAKELSKLFSRG